MVFFIGSFSFRDTIRRFRDINLDFTGRLRYYKYLLKNIIAAAENRWASGDRTAAATTKGNAGGGLRGENRMKIAICDDEMAVRRQIHERIFHYFMDRNMTCEIHEFSQGRRFAEVSDQFDLVFMDCRLEGEDGVEVIRQIRRVNTRLLVVFLTVYNEYAVEAINLDTFRYLIKPVPDEQLREALDSFVRLYQSTRKIIVPTSGETYYLDADDVMYLESDGRNTTVRTVAGQYRSTKRISDFYAEINNSHFFRTHRSYILNMKYVSSIEKKTVVLRNGEKVICSAQNYEEFLKNYMSYLKYDS